MKISVIITLKKDVLDPQGKVIQQTLNVDQGKITKQIFNRMLI